MMLEREGILSEDNRTSISIHLASNCAAFRKEVKVFSGAEL